MYQILLNSENKFVALSNFMSVNFLKFCIKVESKNVLILQKYT